MPALLLVCLLAAEEPAAEPPAPVEAPLQLQGWHFAVFPFASYGSDVGFTLGGALFFYKPAPAHPREHHSFTLGGSYATRGPRSVDASARAVRILGVALQAIANLHLGDDDRMPYWGEGARLGGLSTPTGFGTPPDPYRYHDRRIFGTAILRGGLAGPLGWHVRARWLDVEVAGASALLAASQPPGARGGRVALGEVGLLWDTRDREAGTRRGAFLTAAAFTAPRLGGVSDFSFHGYDASARAYVPLGLGATLAVRALYDRKIADAPSSGGAVPFFERMLYEGIAFNEGLGSAATLRGIARYRVSGTEKALGNVQLRVNLLTTRLAEKTQEWGVDVGLDAGWARQPGYPHVDAAGVAGGLRFLWDRAVLLRIEMARALRGGDATLYIAIGEQF